MIAIMRILYGGQFLAECVEGFIEEVEKFYIFQSYQPWGNITEVIYNGKIIQFPNKWDTVDAEIYSLQQKYPDKIKLIYDYFPTPKGQISYLVNKYVTPFPDELLAIEPDQIFKEGEFKQLVSEFRERGVRSATCRQVELYRKLNYAIPLRGRLGPVLWNFKNLSSMPNTGFFAEDSGIMESLRGRVFNVGYAMGPEIIYWKHLTAIGFSKIVGDTPPNESWYEEKWLNWSPETMNLEPSAGFEHYIPQAREIHKSILPISLLKYLD